MQIKPNKRSYSNKKVTRENIDLILADIRNYAPNKYAAESNGISEAHFYDLVAQGICDLNYGIFDTLHSYLAESLRKIQKEEIMSCRKDIRISEKGHHGAQWTLEHAYWREFCGDAKLMELAREIDYEKGRSHESQSERQSQDAIQKDAE